MSDEVIGFGLQFRKATSQLTDGQIKDTRAALISAYIPGFALARMALPMQKIDARKGHWIGSAGRGTEAGLVHCSPFLGDQQALSFGERMDLIENCRTFAGRQQSRQWFFHWLTTETEGVVVHGHHGSGA